jgi:hypothetical protein
MTLRTGYGLHRSPILGPGLGGFPFREPRTPEPRFPGTTLLGSSVNRGNPPLPSTKRASETSSVAQVWQEITLEVG